MKRILFFLFILNSGFYAAAQNIDSTILKYADDYAQEKAYIQYDKSTYAPGETVWFKAYLLQEYFPTEASKTFYVDWSDDKGNLLFRNVLPIVDGTTNSQFDIPAGYSGKYIHVKAYTRWMLNFDSSFLYNKDIRILSKTASPATAKSTIISSLEFFPEGGDVVQGVSNKVAFKTHDQFGKPLKIKGVIQNNLGKVIDSLHIIHDGMGYFFITPQAGEGFVAKWKDEKGTDNTTPLPAVRNGGISLQVVVSGLQRLFTIAAAPGEAKRLQKINLLGTLNQREVFKVVKDISSGEAKGVIPIQNLPSGILTITAFDEQWNPLAERITYINNEEYVFHPEMNVAHWGLNKRARNEIEISIPDSLQANLAVSVTDVSIDADSSDNIISHLLLTGDIKGQVYNPSYYFSSTEDSVTQAFDLVMLTHGWRRFKWEDVVKGKMPTTTFPKDTSYLSLSGKIYGAIPSDLRGASIILIASQKKTMGKMFLLPIMPNGTFNDPSTILFDTIHIYYQLPKKRFGDAIVKFMEDRLQPPRNNFSANGLFNNNVGDTTGNSRHFLLADEMAKLLSQYEGKVLENVTVTAKTKSPIDEMDKKYTSGLFSGGDGDQFDIVNDPVASSMPTIFQYLQSRVAGLQINTTSSPVTLQWRGGTPTLFVDEVQTDVDMISSIPVTDIAYVKTFRPPFLGAPGGGSGGGIAIYTRRGDDIKQEPGKGLANNVITGYSLNKEFYSPNYEAYKPENERRDIRTTLYWNPQVQLTPQKNKATLVFYNNDVTKSFRVVIEGMTKDGQLAHLEQIME